jgi:bifunctional non-homologous end joining protein LigD
VLQGLPPLFGSRIQLRPLAPYIPVEFAHPIRPSRLHRSCLPSPADRPPSGSNWIHEIKHDGYRLMARRHPVGVRLLTRHGNDWSTRFPLVIEAVNHVKVRSVLIDGEVVCCDERGLANFQKLRQRREEGGAFLYGFDLLELDGVDMRREPIEVRKATLARILRRAAPKFV